MTPTSTAEVARVVRAAGRHGQRMTVGGAGHAAIPAVSAGVLLRTGGLGDVDLDVAARSARVGVGASWHDVIARTVPHGLAPLCGSAPHVDVGGYLLGGGLGPLGRTFGYSSDLVSSIEIVTADGETNEGSTTNEPDLFWALRGGKGGFGVVTAMTVGLLRTPTLYGGGEYYPGTDAPALLRAWRDLVTTDLPETISTSLAIARVPDLPQVPAPIRGRTVVNLRVAYVGSADDAERLLAPLRAVVGRPLLGGCRDLPYAELGTIHNDPTAPGTSIAGGILLDTFDPDTVATILDLAGPDVTTSVSSVEIRHLGGALARPADPLDAVSGRNARVGLWVLGILPPGADADTTAQTHDHIRHILDAVAPWSTSAVQINFCGAVNTAAEAAGAWSRLWPPASPVSAGRGTRLGCSRGYREPSCRRRRSARDPTPFRPDHRGEPSAAGCRRLR